MIFAPIHISVYDRPWHFILCIESLKNNIGASETILYISSDGPKDSHSIEKVSMVREYIKDISGFKRVVTYAPKENTEGTIKIKVRDEVRSFSDRYIISEDDNVFSPYFLTYINGALEFFKDDERVQDISGYMYLGFPAKQKKLYPVLLKAHSAWGVGFWRDKDPCYKIEQREFASDIIKDRKLFKKINYGSPHSAGALIKIANSQLLAKDALRTAILYKYNRYGLFPSISLVRNIGHDGSGEHGGITDKFIKQRIYEDEFGSDIFKKVVCDKKDQDWVRGYFGGGLGMLNTNALYYHFNASNKISRRYWQKTIKAIKMIEAIRGRIKKL